MARVSNGINGAFSGKVGSVVGVTRNGKTYIRGLPRKTRKKPSEKQLACRKSMAAVQDWLRPVKPLVRVGFLNYSEKQHGFGNAVSYLKLHAIGEDLKVDASKAMICWGDLDGPASPELHSDGPGRVIATWNKEGGRWNDRLIFLVHFSGLRYHAMETCGARRSELRQVLVDLPWVSGKEADVYLGFISEDRQRCSMGRWVGRIAAH